MNRRLARISVACIAGLVSLTSACTDEPGTPTAGPATTTTTGASTTSAASGASALTDIKPCDLLASSEATGLNLTNPGKPDRVGGTEACDWSESGNGGLIIGVNPTRGIEDLDYRGENTSPIKVGEYDATKIESYKGAKYTCHVVISASDSSSVQVIGTLKATSTDTAAACERATKAAELIAPKLP
jgi:hypothetical protein